MSGSNLPTIDTTKPAGPNAQTADVRANFAATVAWLDNHDTRIGFLEADALLKPTTPPDVTGSRTDGTALASLLTTLATLGLITDQTTA